jgi:hypothetical protein
MAMKHAFTFTAAILLTVMLSIGAAQAFGGTTAVKKQKSKAKTVATAPKAPKTEAPKDTAVKKENKVLVVYYFMTTYRCHSCHYIEENTRKALDESFANEFKSGRMVFKMINIEEPANAHFVEEYKLYTKSVVLSATVGDKEVKWKNLDKVWQMIGKDDSFKNYITSEVKAYLGE